MIWLSTVFFFEDQSSESLYSFRDVFYSDSQEKQRTLLEDMAEDVRSLAVSLEGTMEDQRVEGGIYDGETLLGAMKKTEARDILSFLRYVI